MGENNRPDLRAFSVKSFDSEDKKDRWIQIGGAWQNKQGGYNIKLDALPIGDSIILLPPKEEN